MAVQVAYFPVVVRLVGWERPRCQAWGRMACRVEAGCRKAARLVYRAGLYYQKMDQMACWECRAIGLAAAGTAAGWQAG